ncbi:hypothetical protein LCGC14_2760350, partial [marine sediment metagenome]
SPSPRKGMATSLRNIAEPCGVTKSAVHHWTRRSDWPFGSPPRWPLSIAKVQLWRARTLTKDASDVGVGDRVVDVDDDERASILKEMSDLDPLKLAKLRKILAETQQIKRKNQILDRFYMDRAKARAEIAAIIHNTTTGILAEARSSAKAIDALGALGNGWNKRVAKLLLERAEALCNRFADSMNDVVDRQS